MVGKLQYSTVGMGRASSKEILLCRTISPSFPKTILKERTVTWNYSADGKSDR
jgi:hypothetical protein